MGLRWVRARHARMGPPSGGPPDRVRTGRWTGQTARSLRATRGPPAAAGRPGGWPPDAGGGGPGRCRRRRRGRRSSRPPAGPAPGRTPVRACRAVRRDQTVRTGRDRDVRLRLDRLDGVEGLVRRAVVLGRDVDLGFGGPRRRARPPGPARRPARRRPPPAHPPPRPTQPRRTGRRRPRPRRTRPQLAATMPGSVVAASAGVRASVAGGSAGAPSAVSPAASTAPAGATAAAASWAVAGGVLPASSAGLGGPASAAAPRRPRRPRPDPDPDPAAGAASRFRASSTGSVWISRPRPLPGSARLAERLQQPLPDPLAGHLHQPERGDLGDLVLGAVPAQALGEPAQHQLAVALQHHVDEVDDDDAADVAQPELADDLLGRLQVVAGDRLLEVAALPGVLAGVDVDDRHRLGAVDHQRAAGGQVDLAVQRP